MTTNDIRNSRAGLVGMEYREYREAVEKLCDDYDKLLAASMEIRDYLTSHPVGGFDIPDEIYVPFIRALDNYDAV